MRISVGIVASITAFGLIGPRVWAIAPYQIVAISGQDAPGTGANAADFLSFADLPGDQGPVINNLGHIAFSGRLIPRVNAIAEPIGPGPIVSDLNDRGIWLDGPGGLSLVAREGMSAGPTSAVFGNGIREPVLNDEGRIAFHANLNRSLDDRSIWSGGPGNLDLIARTGNSAPPSADSNVQFLGLDDPRLNNAGQVAFRSTLAGPDVDPASGVNDRGLWRHSPADDQLRLVTRAGSLAPVEAVPVTSMDQFTEFSQPVLADNGAMAFLGTLSGPDVTTANARGLWVETPLGLFKPIARQSAPAPGTNETFGAIGLPAINAVGQVAFAASLRGEAPGSGIWRSGPPGQMGSLELIARNGQSVGPVDDGTVLGVFHHPVINNRGRVGFSAELDGPAVTKGVNDLGVFITTQTGLRLVARTGDHVSGLPDGVTLAQCDDMDHLTPTMNARGQIAFMSCLASPDAGTIFGKGIFALDTRGDLTMVARTGETIEVRPGQLWTITDLRMRTGSGGGDGLGRSFNNQSHLAFWAALSPTAGPSIYGEAIFDSTVSSTSTWGLGDVNGDGVVDRWDLALLADWWGSSDFLQGDFDLDGEITVNDLGIMQANFGDGHPDGSPSPGIVPEPSTVALAVVSLLAMLIVRRRRGSPASDRR
jgi:hypothetical protein